jgi:hypothetical protein
VNASADAMRRIDVQPLSPRAELGHVLRLGLFVVIGAWMYLATDSALFRDGGAATRHLLPYQALVQDRPSNEQRMFLEIQEGLLESEARRSENGAWPAVAALATGGIPPFTVDPTARGGQYDWRLITNGTSVNYLGLPRWPGAPAWLLLVQEPEPGAPPDPAREDEEHNRLLTGEMLHVSTWVREDARVTDGIIRMPQASGWTQLYAVGPALSETKSPP